VSGLTNPSSSAPPPAIAPGALVGYGSESDESDED
jgi:hypothetical protein